MAYRTRVTCVGAFHDTSFGVDGDGELFYTIADAMAALHARHLHPIGWEPYPVLRASGEEEKVPFPALSNEAYILLWRLDEIDRLEVAELLLVADSGSAAINPKGYMAAEADHVVWVGARQAIRHGSIAEFNEQRAIRNRQDVREAGSVVVTD